MNDIYYLKRAIQISRNSREHGNTPFGALLVDKDGNILIEQENVEITGCGTGIPWKKERKSRSKRAVLFPGTGRTALHPWSKWCGKDDYVPHGTGISANPRREHPDRRTGHPEFFTQ